jgi:transcriptional regulator with XRE-family HTH domain
MALAAVSEQNVRMQQFGNNLRRRAKELGLTDAEVARRVGISERRYGFYVTGDREPDLATLLRIVDILQTHADQLLRPWNESEPSETDRLKAQIQSSAAALPGDRLQLLADVAATFATHDAKSGVMVAGSKSGKMKKSAKTVS